MKLIIGSSLPVVRALSMKLWFIRLPSWGCYTLDGKDIEDEWCTADIKIINSFEDKLNGRDPQLDAAIDEILKQIRSNVLFFFFLRARTGFITFFWPVCI